MEAVGSIPGGFRAAGLKAGIKPSGGLDLALLAADGPCAAAGRFTTNRVAAAPVQWCRPLVPSASIRGIVVNAGNANAATGEQGLRNARRMAECAAEALGGTPEQYLVASTGVIGRQLAMDRVEAGIAGAAGLLSAGAEGFDLASRAILTTDTRPKVVSIAAGHYTLFGMAKGAAMIGPRMATMLGFLLTDAPIAPDDLDRILGEAVEETFNCISVEGHTSTNDTVLALASGSGGPLAGAPLVDFEVALHRACAELASAIVDDAEGATHRIIIDVEGCADREQARTIARAVADSPLVKTAIHGADPNWGRIVSAAGYAGVPFEESGLSLWVNGTELYREGAPLDFDAAAVSAGIKAEKDVSLRLLLDLGTASIRFWTSDLTAEYIRLNADYTT